MTEPRVKLRMVKATTEQYYAIAVLDICDNVFNRAYNSENYAFSMLIRDDITGELRHREDISCVIDSYDIASSDTFKELTIEEYLIFAYVLRKDGFVFNRKTGELFNKKTGKTINLGTK